MGKNNNGGYRNDHDNVKIPECAEDFAKLDFKKFKKKEGKYYDGKKELKRAYYNRLIDDLPDAINFVVYNGHIDNKETKETKNGILSKIVSDEKFISYLTKLVKDGEDIENIKLLPIIVKEILDAANIQNTKLREENPEAPIYDLSNLVELSKITAKKKIKKLVKAGVDENMAFDIVSVFPTEAVLAKSHVYRIHMLFVVLYEYAKSMSIPFEPIIKVLVGEDYYPLFISFALLERKRKFAELTNDSQRAFYNDVTEWCFKTLEELDKGTIIKVFEKYINTRRRDKNDSERRYALTLVSESDYPRIAKVVKKLIESNPDNKKYLE